ncbi:hypothetical protein E2C01_021396 [Portunus trituberculatus]|uniref:Uncharacterized protein n=1 Tax=Portunus trituberculatus TaxID=210409 RepID=A0A5B7E2K9_PORTR|nr:hypothetical protein [Portunus trituberculatus]
MPLELVCALDLSGTISHEHLTTVQIYKVFHPHIHGHVSMTHVDPGSLPTAQYQTHRQLPTLCCTFGEYQ